MVADNEENNLDSFMAEESFTEDNSVSSDNITIVRMCFL